MKKRFKKKKVLEIVISSLILIFFLAIVISWNPLLSNFVKRQYTTLTTPSTIPSYVKRYPSINYEFTLPDTLKNLTDEFFYRGIYPDIKSDEERMDMLKSDIRMWAKQHHDFNKVNFEFVKASLTSTWECDIANNSKVKTPLTGKGYVWLFYNMESYCTGGIIDQLKLTSGTKKFEVAARAFRSYGYSGWEYPKYQSYFTSYFKLDDIPNDLDTPPMLTGVTVGLVDFFRTERSFFKTQCKFDNVWNLAGKTLSDNVLRSNKIEVAIEQILTFKHRKKGRIVFRFKKPYNTVVKYMIIQENNVFSYPPKYLRLGTEGTQIWEDKFDFSKQAQLLIEVKAWKRQEMRELKFENAVKVK